MSGEGTATVGAETAPIKAGDAIPLRVGETKAFENTGTAPLEFLVVGIARDMNKKNDLLATPPQRLGGPGRGRGFSLPVTTPETTSTARYRVVALATTLAMVTYLDRTAIGTLAPGIRRDLGLSAVEMGWIFTAFQLAYGLFEIPTGRWADRVGTRSVLARIVIWWSVMTMATAAAGSYVMMLVVRFLFGEAGAWPSVARTFSRWIPQPERGRVQGIFFCGAHLVAGITPAFIVGGGLLGPWPGLLTVMSWRGVFVTFGCVGLVWAATWLYWFRNDPSDTRRSVRRSWR